MSLELLRGLGPGQPTALARTYYVNFIPEGDEGMVEQAYAANFERLCALKARFDPQNLFRTNINVS